MIPSTTNKLLVTEDWKKIYQSYRNADFKSYDFETLRRTMITYLRENYPEDFNDYIESSEYVALIDLIAYLGQNLSFRIDLNARENFLETAERRESVLRLARLINYNGKRNIPGHGFLKIVSVSTTDNVSDANGINLANQIISWNDPANNNWYQQFTSILNNAMPENYIFGRPFDSATINGIEHQQYRFNSANTDVPVYGFSANVNGTTMGFEIVSSLFAGETYVYEEPPLPGRQFSFIYKNDNRGNSSSNTGFFLHFRQGTLSATNFTLDSAVPNSVITIDAPDINNTDVWLWQLTPSGNYDTLWTKVEDLVGNNVIYNSLNNQVKDIYTVLTRENDAIDLNFSDGSFGNLPKGQFSVFYRQSNGLSYVAKPSQMSNISLSIPYRNKLGQAAVLNIVASLQESISNSVGSETNEEIKVKAPQNFYVQNRMVTAEDYNIAPLSVGSDILKIKSINRVSSGISKYYELSDVSGKYSKTNIFANDGIIYQTYPDNSFEFNFANQTEIIGVLKNQILPIIASNEMRSYYLQKYPRIFATESSFIWKQVEYTTNQSKGFFTLQDVPTAVGEFSGNSLQYLSAGALVKFTAPFGKYFTELNELTSIEDRNTKSYIWTKVVSIVGDGFNNGLGYLDDGSGPIAFSDIIPSGAVVSSIIPKFGSVLSTGIQTEVINISLTRRNFGLSFDVTDRSWYIITDSNLDLVTPFTLSYQKDTTNTGKDCSWLMSFEWTGRNYKVRYRTLDYIFESEEETAFFVDKTNKNYDFLNDRVIKDQINVLSINRQEVESAASLPVLPVTLRTSETSGIGTNILNFVKTTPITTGSYLAVHPYIGNTGTALVTSTSTTQVGVAYNLQLSIGADQPITFIPVTIPAIIDKSYTLTKDYIWQVDSAIVESDGYINPNKVKVSFFDADEDGQIDDPDAFDKIVNLETISEQTGYEDKFVYFKKQTDGLRYKITTENILAYPDVRYVNVTPTDGQLFYFYNDDVNVVKSWSDSLSEYVLAPDYFAYRGRKTLKFHYQHNSGQDRRIDPSKTNLIDVYILNKSYDTEYRNWLLTRIGAEPLAPTSQSLEENYASVLEPIKAISDELVFQPTRYKVLFGDQAVAALQGTFKAVRNSSRFISDNDLKTRIITAIESFFRVENWDFGQTFYFSELSTYVMNVLSPDITNFVVVPKSSGSFGSLFEVTCQSNEIFINGATVNDIEIIDALTASELKASSSVVTSTTGG